MGASASTEVDMTGHLANLVKQQINDNCIVIFSKSYCPYCIMAKKVFSELNIEFKVIELNKDPDGSAVQDILNVMTGARTVPRVFVGGKCIGGGTETKQLHKEGKLKEIVNNCL